MSVEEEFELVLEQFIRELKKLPPDERETKLQAFREMLEDLKRKWRGEVLIYI